MFPPIIKATQSAVWAGLIRSNITDTLPLPRVNSEGSIISCSSQESQRNIIQQQLHSDIMTGEFANISFCAFFHLNPQKLIFQSQRCTLLKEKPEQTKKTCSCLTAETLRERDYRGSSYATVVSLYMLYSWLFKLVSSCV